MDLEQEEEWHRLVGAWGPEARVLGRLGGGPRGDVREVRVEDWQGVGRLSSRSRAAIDWELDLLDQLGAAGLRVPRVIPTASGARRAEHLVVAEWINGRAPAEEDDARRGRYLQRLHELTEDWSQRPGSRSARELLAASSSGDVDLSGLPDEVAAACRAAWVALPVGPRCVVHGDARSDNWLISYDGDPVLIDWDAARVDHPWFDLGALPRPATGLSAKQFHLARRAWCAWEVVVTWTADPENARRRFGELQRSA